VYFIRGILVASAVVSASEEVVFELDQPLVGQQDARDLRFCALVEVEPNHLSLFSGKADHNRATFPVPTHAPDTGIERDLLSRDVAVG
jgi:hypothetical protein